MGMNKKAMTFTILAILFALTLVFFIVMKGRYSATDREQVAISRVESMDNFIDIVEVDIKRSLYIAGFRALISITDYMTEQQSFLNSGDTEKFFRELLFDGTINSQQSSLMIGQTFNKWTTQIINKGNDINIVISFTNSNIILYQESPWNITVELNTTMSISDTAGTASWLRNVSLKTYIPIQNFEDPLYIIKGQKKIGNEINITLYEGRYRNVTTGDCYNLAKHAENSLYANNSDAPSFLDRFEFDKLPWKYSSCCGIESFINALEFNDRGVPLLYPISSMIDHEQWSSSDPGGENPSTCTNLPGWFRISTGHKSRYQVP